MYRLTQTKSLIPQQVDRSFASLVILMGTNKSHFAYRLAWDNTAAEKIPFLPLHRRDLVSTEVGNSTWIGSNNMRVNWKKFQIMGDAVVSIQESQGTPYPNMPRNVDIQRLILDTKILKNEDVSGDLVKCCLFILSPFANICPGAIRAQFADRELNRRRSTKEAWLVIEISAVDLKLPGRSPSGLLWPKRYAGLVDPSQIPLSNWIRRERHRREE